MCAHTHCLCINIYIYINVQSEYEIIGDETSLPLTRQGLSLSLNFYQRNRKSRGRSTAKPTRKKRNNHTRFFFRCLLLNGIRVLQVFDKLGNDITRVNQDDCRFGKKSSQH